VPLLTANKRFLNARQRFEAKLPITPSADGAASSRAAGATARLRTSGVRNAPVQGGGGHRPSAEQATVPSPQSGAGQRCARIGNARDGYRQPPVKAAAAAEHSALRAMRHVLDKACTRLNDTQRQHIGNGLMFADDDRLDQTADLKHLPKPLQSIATTLSEPPSMAIGATAVTRPVRERWDYNQSTPVTFARTQVQAKEPGSTFAPLISPGLVKQACAQARATLSRNAQGCDSAYRADVIAMRRQENICFIQQVHGTPPPRRSELHPSALLRSSRTPLFKAENRDLRQQAPAQAELWRIGRLLSHG